MLKKSNHHGTTARYGWDVLWTNLGHGGGGDQGGGQAGHGHGDGGGNPY